MVAAATTVVMAMAVTGAAGRHRGVAVEAGGFEFWRDVPPDAHGEDVYSQQQVMARFGAAGILPPGAYHQESPTALPDRGVSAVDALCERNSRP